MTELGRAARRAAKAVAAIGLVTATMAVTSVMTTTAVAATAPTCATKNFQIRKTGDQGALGTYLVTLAFRNITNRICTTVGFPGVTIFSHGRKVAVAQRRPCATRGCRSSQVGACSTRSHTCILRHWPPLFGGHRHGHLRAQ